VNKGGTPENLKFYKKGQSGNLKGRKKGSKNIETNLREAMAVMIDMHNPVTGKVERKPAGEFMYAQMVAKAAKEGDITAIDKIFDRIEGKAIARQENKEVDTWQSEFMDVDEE